MRDVAVVASAHSAVPATTDTPIELLIPVINEALANAGLERREVDFWCHGSCDYLVGQPFSFVSAVDALGAWPPIVESHVEMDGAWALYEAWLKIQTGEADTALVFGNGKSSVADMFRVMALQLDPYVEAPLGPDQIALAGLQARVALDAGVITEADMAEVAARSLRDAKTNPVAITSGEFTVEQLLAADKVRDPLRAHDIPAMADGVTAVVIAAGDRARDLATRPAWIRAIDHRIDAQRIGGRDLVGVPSAVAAAQRCGVGGDRVDVAEIHAPFTHEELLVTRALGLDAATTRINPSGGALVSNVLMAAGLARIARAAEKVLDGSADRVVGHATQGPCLQQNLVCVMEGA
jgi:acetyl-CoA acetyltransferase